MHKLYNFVHPLHGSILFWVQLGINLVHKSFCFDCFNILTFFSAVIFLQASQLLVFLHTIPPLVENLHPTLFLYVLAHSLFHSYLSFPDQLPFHNSISQFREIHKTAGNASGILWATTGHTASPVTGSGKQQLSCALSMPPSSSSHWVKVSVESW